MDQEAEEGKDKAGPEKRGETPQVSEHAAWMGSLARSGGSAMLLGSLGVMVALRGGSLQHCGVWNCLLTFPPGKFL